MFALPMMHMRITDHTTEAFDEEEEDESMPPRY